MFTLFSDRLQLIPLTLSDLRLLAESRHEFETTYGLALSDLALNPEYDFMDEFTETLTSYVIPAVEAHPDAWFRYTSWLIVHRERNLTIGGMGGTGAADENGQVMFGYFIDRKFEGQGFASEAAGRYVRWLFEFDDVKAVIADTPAEHQASQKVLIRNGFESAGPVEEGLRWIRYRPETVQV
ncbi:GNAT family N-acetyltransferase [Larkinella soli]|uniref:GNAT family N-acetyltransferase n=1 Tax=Larkinella soli TaxID=1770527 RepID=UPI000FFBDE54|nr:GNAT family N-acetyltransferase [Larkinella soli]